MPLAFITVTDSDWAVLERDDRVFATGGQGGISRSPVTGDLFYTDPHGMITFTVERVDQLRDGKGVELTFDDESGEMTLGVFADEMELERTYGEMIARHKLETTLNDMTAPYETCEAGVQEPRDEPAHRAGGRTQGGIRVREEIFRDAEMPWWMDEGRTQEP